MPNDKVQSVHTRLSAQVTGESVISAPYRAAFTKSPTDKVGLS